VAPTVAETETTNGTDAGETESKAKPRRRPPRRKAVEAHARSYFEAIAKRDTDAIAGHWREDGVDDLVPLRPLRGTEEIAAFYRELFAAVPDMEMTVTRLVAGETQAAVEWRMTGNFTGGPFQGIDPTGKRLDIRGVDVLEIEDGQIVGNTAYYDAMSFARQIGLMPPENSSAESAMMSAFNASTKLRRAVADWRSSR
jgi:steroid delta-isomerase-like uncharacterized protein